MAKFSPRRSKVYVPHPVGPDSLKVEQRSLEPKELEKILLTFLSEYEDLREPVKFVTQIVTGSMISLTISPTKAADD